MTKVALLFPGQGAQFVGMGRDYVAQAPEAADLWERARDVVGYDLARLCAEGPEEELTTTAVSQPAIYATSLAALAVFRTRHADDADRVEAVGGLSLGEYTALAYAEALDFEDGLRLVAARGRFMQQAAEQRSGGMVSILGMDEEAVGRLCEEFADLGPICVANLNCPGQVVVSGTQEACRAVEQAAGQWGAAKAVPLNVAGAFHSELMAPARRRLAAELERVEIRPPRVPVLSNVTGDYHGDAASIRQNLVRQVTSTVLWERCMRRLLADGFGRFREVGPGKVLTGLLRRIDRRIDCENV